MSSSHRAGRRLEEQAAHVLHTERTKYRRRYERAPDCTPIRFVDGTVLVPECKARRSLPKWLLAALEQARGYHPGAVPLLVLREKGSTPLAVLPLVDLATLVGLRSPRDGEQLLLLGGKS